MKWSEIVELMLCQMSAPVCYSLSKSMLVTIILTVNGPQLKVVNDLAHLYKNHLIIHDGDDVYMSKTDVQGRSVVQFLHLQHVKSPFGFLFLKCVEKNGKEIPKSYFSKAGFLQKNSLISKWSQFNGILTSIPEYEFKDTDYVKVPLWN